MYYQHFDECIILDTVMRQTGESAKVFKSILNSVAEGQLQKEQWDTLKTRELGLLPTAEKQHFEDNAVKLCSRNKDLVSHNMAKINQLGTPVAAISAHHTGYGSIADSKLAGGLNKNTVLAKDARVILSSNEWKQAGLVNGARGTVVGIVYREGFQPPSLPDFVLVKFDDYLGPSVIDGMDKVVPIYPIKRDWITKKIPSSRTMLPLKPAYASSIHSSQGLTMEQMIIDLGPEEFCIGLTYTALSRCKTLEGIAFETNFSLKRMTCYYSRKNHTLRKDEDDRLRKMQVKTLERLSSSTVEELFKRPHIEENVIPMEVEVVEDNLMEVDPSGCEPMDVDSIDVEMNDLLANLEIENVFD